ncbi:dihydrolipoamide S-acyltransferase [Natrialba magadii ATCC 43099]|uniref:Branched-chain alpha-keto acid dehydrogenase subunit E2 n=1 Tax=Natrialba magadii (strain ATCC 43099 / DSM 3394 / CCM 3739 / CIP 104546 / IAM 13178 / JCM 8861 / NBRC 102185 / NCIMB 2190 / MS3) TaxID=547559 RepID=D3SUI4_NATMM|nr:2-oxo acid dehydrogenase subunit E2 [Natrialba magadii]ADD05242.1 dihydrolipoamide S-acyltransferase [Natrialba magadii ATCC 43099]ELY29035.1 branched-chain alpha-keto acid dehydrogenase subunit E2 [Natrialba magadii ATCC 43099]
MVREFELPDVGEGVAEGELVTWFVEPGDEVSEDQPVAEVETDKALVEVPAPVNGSVRELHFEEGDVIPVGDVFVTFDVEGEEDTAEADAAAGEAETESDATADADADASPAGDPGATGAGEDTEPAETPDDRIFAPPRVRRLAREEGIDLSQIQGSGPGGRITAADVQAAAGTAPAADAQAQAQAGSGETASSTTEAESTTATAADSSTDESPASGSTGQAGGSQTQTQTQAPAQVESADRDHTLAAPATRRIAEEEGVDLDAVPATEERDGEAFVTPEAVREYAEAQQQAQEADTAAIEAGEAFAEGERERREPFRGVRKTIADAMVESKFSAPHVTHHDEVDVTELVEARKRLKPHAEEQGIRLTYMPFIMKAVVAALQEYPEMNAVIDEANEEIVHRNYYNIGVAAATDVGLMVPVVDNADGKGMLQLSSEMNELVQRARERSISPDELRGSTFTITNIGGIGGEYATPILNYPESGILAVGEIKRKPRVVTDENGDESIEPRSVMTLSLSFDHRLIDGAVGAQFTNTVMEYLENPELLLLE